MSLAGRLKLLANRLGRPLNLRLDSLTAERAESVRLAELERDGRFTRPVFPVLPAFAASDPAPVFAAIAAAADRFARFAQPAPDARWFSLENYYYTTPDAEVLHAMVQLHHPRLVVEVGSGNSTLLFRQAVTDAGLAARIVSIDPEPRRDIVAQTDVAVRERVEAGGAREWFARLQAGDILFIDSSHEVKTGNDVLFLFLEVLPMLAPGVIVHIHDIFLPYEYPRAWVVDERWGWTEQYLVQALLQGSRHWDVIWAGHYLQRTRPDFIAHFRHWRGWDARSLWLRRTSQP